MLFSLLSASLLAGCGSSGVGQSGVDGYWKGEIVEEAFAESGKPEEARLNQRPRRVLLRLEEESGTVRGRFAQSSDAVAFKRIGEDGSRSLATHPVGGTFDGTRLLIRFPAESGLAYEVDAVVGKGMIEGTFVARYPGVEAQGSLSGRFEVERF